MRVEYAMSASAQHNVRSLHVHHRLTCTEVHWTITPVPCQPYVQCNNVTLSSAASHTSARTRTTPHIQQLPAVSPSPPPPPSTATHSARPSHCTHSTYTKLDNTHIVSILRHQRCPLAHCARRIDSNGMAVSHTTQRSVTAVLPLQLLLLLLSVDAGNVAQRTGGSSGVRWWMAVVRRDGVAGGEDERRAEK